MADLVNLTIDGRAVSARAGTLVINAAKQVGIEVPAFRYYDGLTPQAACRLRLRRAFRFAWGHLDHGRIS